MAENKQDFPEEVKARQEILEIGGRMYAKGFVAANDGNISCLVSPNRVVITPAGVSKGFMTEESLVTTDLTGQVLTDGCPSSELFLHLRVYRENPMVRAVVHAHPPAATAFACAGLPLERPILAEAVVQLGQVPVAPFALPGTEAVADSVAPFCSEHCALLLANHGALTWGRDLMEAWFRMETVEYYANLLILTGQLPVPPRELALETVQALRKGKRA